MTNWYSMRARLIRLVIAFAALAGASLAMSAPASAVGKTGSDCSGTYVLGIQVVGPPIYCNQG